MHHAEKWYFVIKALESCTHQRLCADSAIVGNSWNKNTNFCTIREKWQMKIVERSGEKCEILEIFLSFQMTWIRNEGNTLHWQTNRPSASFHPWFPGHCVLTGAGTAVVWQGCWIDWLQFLCHVKVSTYATKLSVAQTIYLPKQMMPACTWNAWVCFVKGREAKKL